MRAYEFLLENREPPPKPITLRALHKLKLEQKRHQESEQERRILMQVMYSDPVSEQEQIDLERQRLELEQLRTEITATKAETKNKSAMALHQNARSGIKAERTQRQKVTKMANSGLGRDLKA